MLGDAMTLRLERRLEHAATILAAVVIGIGALVILAAL